MSKVQLTLRRVAAILVFLGTLAAGASQQSDIAILLGFRDAITNWPQYAAANGVQGWDISTPVCVWSNIACNDQGRVTTVNLQCDRCAVKLQGTLPSNLGGLDVLTSLDLQNNAFTGSLPAEWGNSNQFLSAQTLYLNSNNLTGQVLWRGGAFPNLQLLRLDSNQLSGTLEFLESLLMPSLLVVRLFGNSFEGQLSPRVLAGSPRLQILGLQNNKLSGPLPREWAAESVFQNLQEMYLQGNMVSGGLPSEWGNPGAFQKLQFLNLANNTLGGELPSAWGQPGSFNELRNIVLSDTNLTGTLPPSWATLGAFPLLTTISIDGNNLSGDVNAWQGEFQTMQRLIIKPGNPLLCTSDVTALPFQLCTVGDPSCLRDVPQLMDCATGAPVSALPSADGGGENAPAGGGTSNSNSADESSSSGVPIVAIVVPLAVGIPLVLLVAAFFVVSRRRKSRDKEAEEARKKQLEDGMLPGESRNHPFDTLEGQESLTSPFAATAFSGVNAAAVVNAPSVQGHSNTNTNTNTNNSTDSNISMKSFCAKLRTCSMDICGKGGPTTDGDGQPGTPVQVGQGPPVAGITRMGSTSSEPSRPSFESLETGADMSNFIELSSEFSSELPFSDWEIKPSELEIVKRPDGSDWELGTGGFGKVFKALRNGVQPVAVKKLLGTHERQFAIHEFRKEIALLRAMRDANIVQFQGAYLSPETTFLVTEFMEGGNLSANIQAGRVNWWKRGRKIALDVAKGLVYLHSKRIIHFDLKSPNILLTRDGTAKIADVGMARFLAKDYVSGVMGTLAWAAPEMLWGAKCTEKADIYSYGITLWEICTGETPIRGQLRDIRVPEECPTEVRELVLECLETRPSRRPSALRIAERLRALRTSSQPDMPLSVASFGGAASGGIQNPGSGSVQQTGSASGQHTDDSITRLSGGSGGAPRTEISRVSNVSVSSDQSGGNAPELGL